MQRSIFALSLLLTIAVQSGSIEGTLPGPVVGGSGKKLVKIAKDGSVTWEMVVGGNIHDLQVLPNGNILVGNGIDVREITPDKKVVFQYKPAEKGRGTIYGVQRLANGNTMVGNNENNTVLELDPKGKVVFTMTCKHLDKKGSHNNQRVVRKTKDNTYLVAHKKGKVIAEYKPDGTILREFKGPNIGFSAVRLDNGNTLCAFVAEAIEFDKDGKKVWSVKAKELDGVKNICGLQALPNGNIVIGTYKGIGKGGKYSMLEITRDKKVVWGCTDAKIGKSMMAAQRVLK